MNQLYLITNRITGKKTVFRCCTNKDKISKIISAKPFEDSENIISFQDAKNILQHHHNKYISSLNNTINSTPPENE